jgi:AcrR family transcriptional regulator
MGQAPHDLDPRRRRTREALQSAFTLLAQERRYHEIRIDDILQASGVSR